MWNILGILRPYLLLACIKLHFVGYVANMCSSAVSKCRVQKILSGRHICSGMFYNNVKCMYTMASGHIVD